MERLASWLVGTVVLSLAPPASAAIPQLNGTCPGGIEVHADAGGPVFVNGREAALKRFSDQYYEARDAQASVTLSLSISTDGSPQLSYTGQGGRNGICEIAGTQGDAQAAPMHRHDHGSGDDGADGLPVQVTCESQGKQQTSCPMNTQGAVVLDRQLSRTRCVEGQTWGLSRHAVWVTDGCRATFRNTSADVRRPTAATGSAIAACDTRKGQVGRLVTQVPVGQTHTEVIVDYNDGRYLCMVTVAGEVSSLTPVRAR